MNIKMMRRIELLRALAAHADPSWYQQLLTWPTEGLRVLLNYYTHEYQNSAD